MMMRNKLLGLSMAAATVLVTVWRVLALPATAGNGTALTHVNYPLLIVMAVVTAVLLVLGRASQDYTSQTRRNRALTVSGAVFGAVLALTSLWDIVQFMWKGIAPAPFERLVSAADRMLLSVSLISGFFGGLFLAVWFAGLFLSPDRPFRWWGRRILAAGGVMTGALTFLLFFNGYQLDMRSSDVLGASRQLTVMLPMLVAVVAAAALCLTSVRAAQRHTFSEKWLWLLLPLWAFARLARYNVVFASTVDISPAVYEFFLYALILLFLLETAKCFSRAEKPTRLLRGLAAATAVLAVSAGVSRLVLFFMGQTMAVAYCSIPSVTEAALGAFAAVTALTLAERVASHTEE